MGFQSESQAAERETNTTQTLSNELKKALTVTCKETGKTRQHVTLKEILADE